MIALQESSQISSIPTHKEATPRQIKKYLEKKFGHKFSVRQGRGTASHWIDITWDDGASGNEVRSACSKFNDDEHDDIMTDLWCGSQYTSEQRHITPKSYLYSVYVLSKHLAIPMPKVTVEISKWTKTPQAWIQPQDDVQLQESNGCRPFRFTEKLNLFQSQTNFTRIDFKNPNYFEVTSGRSGNCWIVYGVCGDRLTAESMAKEHQGTATEVPIKQGGLLQ